MNEPVLAADATLRDAVRVLEESRRFIAVVVDASGRLLGTVSDGDVRRAILAGKKLSNLVIDSMAENPVTVPDDIDQPAVQAFIHQTRIAAVPVVDSEGRFLRVEYDHSLYAGSDVPQSCAGYGAAVIMAGGEGRRLRPLTETLPKPMIEVGGVPLLERQVRRLAQAGISRIYISTNYLGHVIEDYFGDGDAFGVVISYLRERTRLGTAGALSLLPEWPSAPLLVINGDVLTTSDYGALLGYHLSRDAMVTVSAVQHSVEIPYGVLELEGTQVVGLAEKPTQTFLCNAGIYAVSPEAAALVAHGEFIDMTDLIRMALDAGKPVAVFPIHEFWADIGTPSDLERAIREVEGIGGQ